MPCFPVFPHAHWMPVDPEMSFLAAGQEAELPEDFTIDKAQVQSLKMLVCPMGCIYYIIYNTLIYYNM